MEFLTDKHFEEYKQIRLSEFSNNNSFYINDDKTKLLKLCPNINPDNAEFMRFIIEQHPEITEHISYPIEMFKVPTPIRNSYLAYVMSYYQNATSIYSQKAISLNQKTKLQITRDLYKTLKKLHEYIILGDIRNSNILITAQNTGLFIDWENFLHKELSRPLSTYYKIDNKNRMECETALTDTIKFAISCASLILGQNFEPTIKKSFFDFRYAFAEIINRMPNFESIAHILTSEREHNMYDTLLTEEQLILGLTKKMD